MPSAVLTWTEEFNGQGVISPGNSKFTHTSDLSHPGLIPFIMKDGEARPERILDRDWSQTIDGTLYLEGYAHIAVDSENDMESIGDGSEIGVLDLIDVDPESPQFLDGVLKIVKELSKDLCEWDLYGLELLNDTALENGIPPASSPEDLSLLWDNLLHKMTVTEPLASPFELATALLTIFTLVHISAGVRLLNLECSWRVRPEVGRVQDRANLFRYASTVIHNMHLHHPEGINIGFPSLVYGDAPNITVNGEDPIYIELGKTYAGASYDVRYAGTENLLYLNGSQIAPLDLPTNFGSEKAVRYPTGLFSATLLALNGDEVKNYLVTNGEAAIHLVAYDRFSASVELWYPKGTLRGVLKVLTQDGWRRA